SLFPQDIGTGQKSTHVAEVGHHFNAFEDAHPGHLPHHTADLLELVEELLDFVRLGAAAGGDPAPAVDVDDVRIAAFFAGHRVDHAANAPHGFFGVFAFGNHLGKPARHAG